MKWFGESWGAPVCERATHAPVPLLAKCPRCDDEVHIGDQGVIIPFFDGESVTDDSYHLACFLEALGVAT